MRHTDAKRILFFTPKWMENKIDISNPITLEQKSSIYPKIHIFKVSFLTKFTFSKSHFSKNSHFQSVIFDKIHIFKISFFTKFTFSNSHFSQNSHFQIPIFQTWNSKEFLDKKLGFAPVWWVKFKKNVLFHLNFGA